jgi:hypothetical protein
VDADHQVIVATNVTNQASDVKQLLPMMQQTEENTSKKVQQCSADAGYSSGENLQDIEQRKIDAYMSDREYQAQQRGKTVDNIDKDSFAYDDDRDCYVCIEGQVLLFSHLQKRKNKGPLRIYRGRNCTTCPFFGRCNTNKNGRSISQHPYEKELRKMRHKLDSDSAKQFMGNASMWLSRPLDILNLSWVLPTSCSEAYKK